MDHSPIHANASILRVIKTDELIMFTQPCSFYVSELVSHASRLAERVLKASEEIGVPFIELTADDLRLLFLLDRMPSSNTKEAILLVQQRNLSSIFFYSLRANHNHSNSYYPNYMMCDGFIKKNPSLDTYLGRLPFISKRTFVKSYNSFQPNVKSFESAGYVDSTLSGYQPQSNVLDWISGSPIDLSTYTTETDEQSKKLWRAERMRRDKMQRGGVLSWQVAGFKDETSSLSNLLLYIAATISYLSYITSHVESMDPSGRSDVLSGVPARLLHQVACGVTKTYISNMEAISIFDRLSYGPNGLMGNLIRQMDEAFENMRAGFASGFDRSKISKEFGLGLSFSISDFKPLVTDTKTEDAKNILALNALSQRFILHANQSITLKEMMVRLASDPNIKIVAEEFDVNTPVGFICSKFASLYKTLKEKTLPNLCRQIEMDVRDPLKASRMIFYISLLGLRFSSNGESRGGSLKRRTGLIPSSSTVMDSLRTSTPIFVLFHYILDNTNDSMKNVLALMNDTILSWRRGVAKSGDSTDPLTLLCLRLANLMDTCYIHGMQENSLIESLIREMMYMVCRHYSKRTATDVYGNYYAPTFVYIPRSIGMNHDDPSSASIDIDVPYHDNGQRVIVPSHILIDTVSYVSILGALAISSIGVDTKRTKKLAEMYEFMRSEYPLALDSINGFRRIVAKLGVATTNEFKRMATISGLKDLGRDGVFTVDPRQPLAPVNPIHMKETFGLSDVDGFYDVDIFGLLMKVFEEKRFIPTQHTRVSPYILRHSGIIYRGDGWVFGDLYLPKYMFLDSVFMKAVRVYESENGDQLPQQDTGVKATVMSSTFREWELRKDLYDIMCIMPSFSADDYSSAYNSIKDSIGSLLTSETDKIDASLIKVTTGKNSNPNQAVDFNLYALDIMFLNVLTNHRTEASDNPQLSFYSTYMADVGRSILVAVKSLSSVWKNKGLGVRNKGFVNIIPSDKLTGIDEIFDLTKEFEIPHNLDDIWECLLSLLNVNASTQTKISMRVNPASSTEGGTTSQRPTNQTRQETQSNGQTNARQDTRDESKDKTQDNQTGRAMEQLYKYKDIIKDSLKAQTSSSILRGLSKYREKIGEYMKSRETTFVERGWTDLRRKSSYNYTHMNSIASLITNYAEKRAPSLVVSIIVGYILNRDSRDSVPVVI